MNTDPTHKSTPVEELRAAGAKLREAAATADKSSWYSAEAFAHSLCGEDVAWLALMHPALAEPLAEWLERLADTLDAVQRAVGAQDFEGTDGHALAVARVINGTAK